IHEGRGTFRPPRIEELWILGDEFREQLIVTRTQRLNYRDCLGIHTRDVGFIGESIRPVSALLNPGFDEVDLLCKKRTGPRHVRGILARPIQSLIKEAILNAAGHDAPETEDGAFPVEAQSAHLLRGSMTTDAVLPEDGKDITAKINFGGTLS